MIRSTIDISIRERKIIQVTREVRLVKMGMETALEMEAKMVQVVVQKMGIIQATEVEMAIVRKMETALEMGSRAI